MVINRKKTTIMKFNRSRKFDFPPEFALADKVQLETVSEVKLLGVMVSNKLGDWEGNTQYICKKAMGRMWIIQRLKKLRVSLLQMKEVYEKEIRPILELSVQTWHSGLTKRQVKNIERVQKTFLVIVLGHFASYQEACESLNLQPLEERRQILCLNFCRKELKKSNSLFSVTNKQVRTRSAPLVKEYNCRTGRFYKSSLPYLSRLINEKLG